MKSELLIIFLFSWFISSGQTDIDIYRTVYIYQESKNYKQANLLYDSIINYYRHDHKAYFNRGVCRYNLAKYEDAVKDFETAIKLNANYTDAYLNKGLCFLKLNKIDSALNYFDWIVDNKPHYRNPGYRYKGIVHTIQGNYTKAKESYLNFLALDSTNAIAYFELGNLFLSNNEIDMAVKYYKACLYVDSTFYPAYGNLAIGFIILADYEKALEYANRSVLLNNQYSEGFITLSSIHGYLNNVQKFYFFLEKALKLGYNIVPSIDTNPFTNFKDEDRFKGLVKKYK